MGGFNKTWETLTYEQKQTIVAELKAAGLDRHQVESLTKFKGQVTEADINLMLRLPDSRWGKRPTINVAREAISTCKKLGLLEDVPNKEKR